MYDLLVDTRHLSFLKKYSKKLSEKCQKNLENSLMVLLAVYILSCKVSSTKNGVFTESYSKILWMKITFPVFWDIPVFLKGKLITINAQEEIILISKSLNMETQAYVRQTLQKIFSWKIWLFVKDHR